MFEGFSERLRSLFGHPAQPPPELPLERRPRLSRFLRAPAAEPVDKRWVYATATVGTIIVARRVPAVRLIGCVSVDSTHGTCMMHTDTPNTEPAYWAEITIRLAGVAADDALNGKRRAEFRLIDLVHARKLHAQLMAAYPEASPSWIRPPQFGLDYDAIFHDDISQAETDALNGCYAHARSLISAEIEAARKLTRALYDDGRLNASQWESELCALDRVAPMSDGMYAAT